MKISAPCIFLKKIYYIKKILLREKSFEKKTSFFKKWLVNFKSHYNKTKISEMDISNIYLKNESFEIFAQD